MNVNLRAKKILIIEDYSAMRMSIKEMLHINGAQTMMEADNAKAALAIMEKHKFDIIMCDYNLGIGKNGQQLLEEAKFRKLLTYSTIFIMVTAEQTQSMVLSAMENKPDEYLTKPFNAQQLLARIQKQMAQKAYFADIEQAIAKDHMPQAISHCDALLQEPNARMRTQLLRIRAELAINVGDFTKAQHCYQEVLSQRELVWAKLGLAIIAFLQDQFETAITQFNAVIDQAPMLMESYDWLSKAYEALAKRKEAQHVLVQAVELSPQAILRQQKLAVIADKLGNLDVAQKAYKSAIKLGEFSVHKSCQEYSGLAKIYAKGNDAKAALKLLTEMRDAFQKSPEAELRAANLEVEIHTEQNNKALKDQAYAKIQLLTKHTDAFPKDLLLDVAETHYLAGNHAAGEKLMVELIRNHSDEENFINDLVHRHKTITKDEHFAQDLFNKTKQELIEINNQGVHLFKKGEVNAALDILESAYQRMPNNKTIIMNLAKILLRDIKTSGISREKLLKIKALITKAADLGVSQDKTGFIKMEIVKLSSAKPNLI